MTAEMIRYDIPLCPGDTRHATLGLPGDLTNDDAARLSGVLSALAAPARRTRDDETGPNRGLSPATWSRLGAREADCGCCLIVDLVALRETLAHFWGEGWQDARKEMSS